MNEFRIETMTQQDDGIGGVYEAWASFLTVSGYLDLITGSDQHAAQNAVTEQSTHVLVIPDFTPGLTDDMRVVDAYGRIYSVTYADDPVGVGHHNELYLKFERDAHGQGV